MSKMRKFGFGQIVGLAFVAMTAACAGGATQPASPPPAQHRFSPNEIAAKANPSVVLIESELVDGSAFGSGFVVGSDGRIATNMHVIEGAREGRVVFPDGRKLRIVGVTIPQQNVDLALVHIEADGLPILPLGDAVRAGDHVVAIGNPRGLDHTVSDGLVSRMRQFGERSLVQISAPISPGSSGGPVLNDRGEVVAVVVSHLPDAQNLNFGVPVSELKALVNSKTTPLSMTEFRLTSNPHVHSLDRQQIAAETEQCQRGRGRSCNALGSRYRHGRAGERDDAKAAEFFTRACDANDMHGCANLGTLFRYGEGVARDLKRALALFDRSCKGGEVYGCWHLGDLHLKGEGVAKNAAQGTKLMEHACDGGAHAACAALGELYDAGQVVPKRPDRAAAFYQRACDGFQAKACTKLGILVSEGRGAPRDDTRAATLFGRGCDHRDTEGCARYGAALVEGRGVAEDRTRGTDLLRVGCRYGSGWSCDKLRTLKGST